MEDTTMDLITRKDIADANRDLINLAIEVTQHINELRLSESATRGLGVLLTYVRQTDL